MKLPKVHSRHNGDHLLLYLSCNSSDALIFTYILPEAVIPMGTLNAALPAYVSDFIPFTSEVIVGNVQQLYGGGPMNFIQPLGGNSFIKIEDRQGLITALCDGQFSGANNLTEVILNGCLVIGDNAFDSCTGLIKLWLPVCTQFGINVGAGNDGVFAGIAGNAINCKVKTSTALDEDFSILNSNNTLTVEYT